MTRAAIRTMDEAAAELRVSRRWLQDFLRVVPPCHLQAGHKKLFDQRAMDILKARMSAQRMTKAQREQKLRAVNVYHDALEFAVADKKYRQGFVYFAAMTALVKIGFASDVPMRLDALQTASPEKLDLIHVEPGTIKDEREYHKQFAHLRRHGEWFALEGDLVEFIERMNGVGK